MIRKIAQWSAILLGLLLAVALIAPFFLKDKVDEIIKTEANKLLTATLDFEELNISLIRRFPNASLELNGLSLVGGESPFVGDTIVAADRIAVVVNLMSLIGDEGFEVRRLLLDRPRIHGHIDSLGRANWEVMRIAETEADTEIEAADSTAESSSFRLALRDVTITEAELRYENDSTAMLASIYPLDLALRGDFSAAQSQLKLTTTAQNIRFGMGGTSWVNGVEAEIRADLDADLEQMTFTLRENTLRLNAIEMMLDGRVAMLDQGLEVDLALNSNRVEFRELLSLIPAFYTQDFKELTASGGLTLTAQAQGKMVGDLWPAFSLNLGVEEGSFSYAMLPKSVSNIYLQASVENPGGSLDATRLEIPRFGMTMAGNTLQASLSVATPMSDLQFAAWAEGKVDLGAIKEVYPLDASTALEGLISLDMKAAGRMSQIEQKQYEQISASGMLILEQMKARLAGIPEVQIERMTASVSPQALILGELNVKVGESDLRANGQLTNYLGWLLRDDVLSGRLYLQSNLLNLNEMLEAMPTETNEAKEEEPASTEPATATMAPEIPRNLDLHLNCTLDRLLFQKMQIEAFTGDIRVKGGEARLTNLKMEALGGKLAASGSYSTAQNPMEPQLTLQAQIQEALFARTFDELEMIQKMVPLFEKTGGNYSMNFSLKSSLMADMSPNYDTLTATGEISSSNIQLGNVPIFQQLSGSLKSVGNLQSSLEGKLVVVKFSIDKGRLKTQPFDLKLGSTTLNLSGSTGLDQTIDYTARIAMPGKVGSALQQLNVTIGGTFSKPTLSLNVAEAAKEVAKAAANQAVNEQIERLTGSENLNQEIQKQAEKLRNEARKAGEKLVAEAEKQKAALMEKANGKLAQIAAEKAGDALVKEAQKQADNLMRKAEEEIAKIEAKTASKS